MNELEAKLILRCQMSRSLSAMEKLFPNYSYHHARTLNRLNKKGRLTKRKLDKKVYYMSTKEAVLEAVEVMNTIIDDKNAVQTQLSMQDFAKHDNKATTKEIQN